jgi:plastocyanin
MEKIAIGWLKPMIVVFVLPFFMPALPASGQGTVVDVNIPGFFFNPDVITIEIGTTVHWTNNHSIPHTSTSDDGVWDSGNLNFGQDYSFTFLATGIYPYHCAYHSLTMTGMVTVVSTGATTDINIPDLFFDPADITVDVGTVVRWINNDIMPHTATSTGGYWDSGNLGAGGNFSYLFLTPGDFPYLCSFHTFMTGKVTVIEPLICMCGDANLDDLINILDVVYIINFKYKSGSPPAFPECNDVNNDNNINILDIVFLINYKYKSGPAPVC